MAHDTYYDCPCGSGKKVKFCCGRPVAAELEKILRAIGGDQRIAALNLVRSARKKAPENPALLTVQSQLELELDQPEQLDETLETLARVAPGSTVGLSIQALRAVQQDDWRMAVDRIQDALEAADPSPITEYLYEALPIVGQMLLLHGRAGAAFAHFALQAAMGPDDDRRPRESLARLCRLRDVPLAFRYFRPLRTPSEDAAWKDQAESILDAAYSGQWRKSADELARLREQNPEDPDLLYNLGLLRMHLAQDEEAAEAFRAYSRLPGLPIDDAVEAEALAQLVQDDGESQGEQIENVKVVFELSELDPVLERLLSEPLLGTAGVDPGDLVDEDDPPPRAAFTLMSQAMPEEWSGDDWRALPERVADVLVFGKQTDRAARVELFTMRDEGFEARKAQMAQWIGEQGREVPEQEVVSAGVDAATHALMWSWVFPHSATREQRDEAVRQRRGHSLREVWPTLSMTWLDGRTPLEAADDPQARIPLQAAILNIELAARHKDAGDALHDLRQKLNLPTPAPITGPLEDAKRLPLERLARVDVGSLSDEELLQLFPRVLGTAMIEVTREILAEMERRGGDRFREELDFSFAYAALSSECDDPQESLELLAKAEADAVAVGRSPARFILASIPQHFLLGNMEEATQRMSLLQSKYINEPGIAQGLYELVASLEAMQQRYAQGAGQGAAGQSGAGPQPAATAAPGAGESKLWTPGSDVPGGGSGEKSKLWVPGMD